MGRPTKMTKARAKVIIAALKRGLSIASAAKAGGIAESTFMLGSSRGWKPPEKTCSRSFRRELIRPELIRPLST